MKKLVVALLAFMAIVACSDDKASFNYRGLSFNMPTAEFVDSMSARGFAIDSAASDSGRMLDFVNSSELYRVLVAFSDQQIEVVQENYHLSTNDSTRMLWQQIRDGLEKELGAWPDCPLLKDDHKVANFDSGNGFISVTLENTYTPNLYVRYMPKKEK